MCQSLCPEGGLFMMSLSLWLPGAMFLLGGFLCLVSCSFWGSGGSLSRGSVSMGVCVHGGLCLGVSVQGVYVQGGLCLRGCLSGGSQSGGSLSRQGLCPRGLPDRNPPPRTETPLYGEEWAVRILLECFLCWCPLLCVGSFPCPANPGSATANPTHVNYKQISDRNG